MKLFLCGNDIQLERLRNCVRKDNTIVGSINLIDCPHTSLKSFLINYLEDNDVLFIADELQAEVLVRNSISAARVLRYDWFNNTYFDNPIDGFSNDYNALVFGMSHSECGIDTDYLNTKGGLYKYFKESAPSLDLFLHYHLFKVLSEQNDVSYVKRVIIELPYYIFNYDLSKFGSFVITKLNYFEIVKEYHHLTEGSGYRQYIQMFHLYWELFEEAVYKKSKPRKLPKYLLPAKLIYHLIKCLTNHDKVWEKEYPVTIKENAFLFGKLIDEMRLRCPNAELLLLVMPFNPAFRISHKRQINSMKTLFYSTVGDKIRIIDDFSCINKVSLYQDHCHLNDKGTSYYSKKLYETLGEIDGRTHNYC